MFNLASRALFGIAVFCLAADVVYANTTSDRVGFLLLAVGCGVSVFLGLAALSATGPADRAALAGVQVPLEGRAPQASWMPIIAALSGGGVVLGLALGVWAYAFALAGLALAGLGWFVVSWREHPNFHARVRARISDRFSMPFGLPVAVAGLLAVSMIAVSRILLALTKTGSTVAAIVLAMVVLLVGCVFAARPKIDRRLLGASAVVAAVAVLAMGVVGIVKGERDFEHHHGEKTEKVESGVTPASGAEGSSDASASDSTVAH